MNISEYDRFHTSSIEAPHEMCNRANERPPGHEADAKGPLQPDELASKIRFTPHNVWLPSRRSS